MAITLNGSSQYVNLANGSNVQSARPIFFAALVRRGATGAYHGLFAQGDYSDRGWQIEIASDNTVEIQMRNSGGASVTNSTLTIANTGWWFIGVCIRDSGSATLKDVFAYRYATSTLTVNAGIGSTSDADPTAPNAGDKCLIGAWHDGGTLADYFSGDIGWAAVFSADKGNAGDTNAAAVWELITRGPWGMLDSNCKLFMPFAGVALDISGAGLNGTLNGSPSYTGSGPTEFAPSLWVVPDYVTSSGDQTISPSAIASLEAFGTDQLNLELLAQAIASLEAFGSHTMQPGAVTVSPSAIASLEAFGTDQLNLELLAQAIASLEAFGSPQLNLTLTLTGISSAEAFGTLQLDLALVLQAISSAEAFGSASVSIDGGPQTVSPAGIASGEAFGTLRLDLALALQAIASAEAFGSAALTVYITPAGIASGEAFGTARLDLALALQGIASAEAFGTARLDLALVLQAIASGEAFGTLELFVAGQLVAVRALSLHAWLGALVPASQAPALSLRTYAGALVPASQAPALHLRTYAGALTVEDDE